MWPDYLRSISYSIATGGRVVRPAIPGIDRPCVTTFEDVLRCRSTGCENFPEDRPAPVSCGEKVVVWGDHFGAADVAEQLGFSGHHVTVVTPHSEFAAWMEPCHRDIMQKRFDGGNGEGLKGRSFAQPVTIYSQSSIMEVTDRNSVILVNAQFERREIEADTIVLGDVEPQDELYELLLEAGVKVVKIGDAQKVRNLRSAITDGANVALSIEADAVLNANLRLVANLPSEVAVEYPVAAASPKKSMRWIRCGELQGRSRRNSGRIAELTAGEQDRTHTRDDCLHHAKGRSRAVDQKPASA